VIVVGVQAGALAALPVGWPAVAVTALACALGRVGFAWCVRAGVPAARPDGLGATVAGTQPAAVALVWWLALGACGLAVVPGRWWAGPAAAVAAALVVLALSAHTARRFGGTTGDVLGAASELGTTAALVVLATAVGVSGDG
jgi:adenosylcobinamide-GDP ribazoletransferase